MSTTEQEHSHEISESDAILVPRAFRALEKIKNRIELTSVELDKVREENTSLAERLMTLESEISNRRNSILELDLEEDPELLKKKVDGFIHALDTYLANLDTIEDAPEKP